VDDAAGTLLDEAEDFDSVFESGFDSGFAADSEVVSLVVAEPSDSFFADPAEAGLALESLR
jgi:hypothetical protein